MRTDKQLKAFVRIDASGRVVPSSLVLRKNMPKNGKWYEVPSTDLCCGTTSTTTTCVLPEGGYPLLAFTSIEYGRETIEFQHSAENACIAWNYLLNDPDNCTINWMYIYVYAEEENNVFYSPLDCAPIEGLFMVEGPPEMGYVIQDFVNGVFDHTINCLN